MIISRTPLRVSFMGGGGDLPAFYEQEPCTIISTAIDKYIYINVNRKFDRGIRASYSSTEIVERLDDLKHELIRESLRTAGVFDGIEITSISDIPSEGTGMGSSSSYTVGLLNALHAYQGRHPGAERLAQEACRIEIDICGKPIGKQDQYAAAYGGLQCYQFNPDGSVFADPVVCRRETRLELQRHLLLLYTGVTRSANPILQQLKQNVGLSPATRSALRTMSGMARAMQHALSRDDLSGFGGMLHEGWRLKRSLAAGTSTTLIDDCYARARSCGAIGGKILGAGGGGFLLLFAPPDAQAGIVSALPELTPTPFQFEPQGSKIIYVEEARAALTGDQAWARPGAGGSRLAAA